MRIILKKVKKSIIALIGINNYKTISTFLYRVTNNYHKKLWLGIDEKQYICLKEKNKNVYFGYYDHSSERDNKVLYICTTNNLKDEANIYYYDINKHKSIHIAATNAWNYQMGSRVRWIHSSSIMFNNYKKKEGFFSEEIDLNGSCKKKYGFPIYDLSRDEKYGFYLDFTILNHFRPGYGYSNIDEKIDNNRILKNGIYRGDLKENKSKLILPISKIISYKNNTLLSLPLHYINHISCSKFDDILLFFHLWYDEQKQLRNRVFIIDYSGNIINVLDDFEKASHYAFKSKNELLLTVVNKGQIEYRLYNILNNEYKVFEFLSVDGHPSYINDKLFITDTYPDKNGMQHIFVCDENGIKQELIQIYHNPRKNNEIRCDLHPRYSGKILTFDSISRNYRNENILNVDLHNLRTEECKNPDISYEKKIYMNLFNKIDINIIKMWYRKIFDISFKAHLLVNKMLSTKSKFKREIYYNRLQKKYSMWISPKCKIGNNIHFMHLDGITIGSGAIIGDNCTIYHQVTIGKKNGKFPIIGNNVTIYPGAKIIGDVKIGDNSIIGANAVVIKDVPENSVAVGVPAKILYKE